jgi:hypothetical protein
MNDKIVSNIVELQQRIAKRLLDLGYTDKTSSENLSRQLASIAVLGDAFAHTTLPLFLTLDGKHQDSIAQLSTSIKCDLEELSDAILDIDIDLRFLMKFLNNDMP